MIKECQCVHPYQDSIYGKGKRVHNISQGKSERKIYYCTVCGTRKEDLGGKK